VCACLLVGLCVRLSVSVCACVFGAAVAAVVAVVVVVVVVVVAVWCCW